MIVPKDFRLLSFKPFFPHYLRLLRANTEGMKNGFTCLLLRLGKASRKHPPHFLFIFAPFKHLVQHPCQTLNLKLYGSVVLSGSVLYSFYINAKYISVAAVIMTLLSMTTCQGPPLPREFRGISPLHFSC